MGTTIELSGGFFLSRYYSGEFKWTRYQVTDGRGTDYGEGSLDRDTGFIFDLSKPELKALCFHLLDALAEEE